MNKRIWKNLELKTAAILLAVVILLSVSLYYIVYSQYYGLVLSRIQEDASTINEYVQRTIAEETFSLLNTREDEQTELYIEAHNQLDYIRQIGNLLYLYTAKKDAGGNYIYVVDGLNEDDIAEGGYFCHVGDPIEDEIVQLLSRCLDGEVVFGDEILRTDWGIVYAAYFPYYSSSGEIIGAVGMEFDCEHIYNLANRTRLITTIIVLAIAIVFTCIAYTFIRRIVKKTETAIIDVENERNEARELMNAIMNASPMCCNFLSRDGKIIDCNDTSLALFGFEDKQDYIKNWMFTRNPEYQPDGQRSETKGRDMLEKAFADGKHVFSWVHALPGGVEMPAEVTLVRVKSGNDSFVAGYTRDLRREKELEEQVGDIFFDELTGAYTREYLEDKLSRLIRILSRTAGELSVMMVSIDCLGLYYGSYGNNAGDECMRRVADILKTFARRADDFVARFRTGDFVIVLPNTGKVGAQMLAESIIEEMHMQNIPHRASSVTSHLTVSIGVTTGKVFFRQRVSDYIGRAQEMLYISKQSGRNKSSYADL